MKAKILFKQSFIFNECQVSNDIFSSSIFVNHFLLDVVNYTDDAVGVGCAPVDNCIHADRHTIPGQYLNRDEIFQ